jgi:hypothetical protein
MGMLNANLLDRLRSFLAFEVAIGPNAMLNAAFVTVECNRSC